MDVASTTQPQCGVCHSVEEAGTIGAIGPKLDDLRPTKEQVERVLANGVGVMPSYGQSLTAEEISDLAAYVFEVTR